MRLSGTVVVAGCLVMCSCAGVGSASRYEITATENAEAQRFALTLKNNTAWPMCFDSLEWVDQSGRLHADTGRVRLETEGRSISPVGDLFNTDCIGCGIRVAPRATARGTLRFDHFPGVDWTRPAATRVLRFEIRTSACESDPGRESYDRENNLTRTIAPQR